MPGKRVIQFLRTLVSDEPQDVAVDNPLPIIIKSPLESNGAVPVNIQDQTSEIIDVYMTQIIKSTTLSENSTIDTYEVKLTAGHGAVAGNMIVLKEGTHFYQAIILNVATDTITMDRPLDFAFTTASHVDISTNKLNVNGSVTRQIFRVTPSFTTIKFDVTRIIFSIEDNAPMDTSTFGGLTKLTRGIVIRKKDGVYKNIFNAKSNDDLAHHCDIVEYVAKAPSGEYGLLAKRKFAGQNENGVVMRLDSATNDQIELIVQDDLTGLLGFNIIVQGHVVAD